MSREVLLAGVEALLLDELRLEADNVQLHNEHPKESARITTEVELSQVQSAENERLVIKAEQLRQLSEQAIADLCNERAQAREGITSLEHRVQDLTEGQKAAQVMVNHCKLTESEKSVERGQQYRAASERQQMETEQEGRVIAEAPLMGWEENLWRSTTNVNCICAGACC